MTRPFALADRPEDDCPLCGQTLDEDHDTEECSMFHLAGLVLQSNGVVMPDHPAAPRLLMIDGAYIFAEIDGMYVHDDIFNLILRESLEWVELVVNPNLVNPN